MPLEKGKTRKIVAIRQSGVATRFMKSLSNEQDKSYAATFAEMIIGFDGVSS